MYIYIKECCVPSKTTPHVSVANVVSSESDDSVAEGIHNDNAPLSIPRVQIIKHILPKRSSYTTYRDSVDNEDMTNSACSFGNYDNNASSYSKLYLTGTLFFNKQLIITYKGLMKSLRKKSDSHVFFGMINTKDCTDTPYNDFIINTTELSIINASVSGRVFEISYNMKDNNYTLLVKHPHVNIMYSIEHFFFFQHDVVYHVLFGHVPVQFTMFSKERSLLLEIRIENTTNNENENVYTISPYNTPVIIGRDNCDVALHHKSVSKKHCTVMYSKIERRYYLKDEGSSNGLVLVLKENDSIVLKGNMTFRIERSKFKIMEMP